MHCNTLRDLCRYLLGTADKSVHSEFMEFWRSCTTAEQEYFRSINLEAL